MWLYLNVSNLPLYTCWILVWIWIWNKQKNSKQNHKVYTKVRPKSVFFSWSKAKSLNIMNFHHGCWNFSILPFSVIIAVFQHILYKKCEMISIFFSVDIVYMTHCYLTKFAVWQQIYIFWRGRLEYTKSIDRSTLLIFIGMHVIGTL